MANEKEAEMIRDIFGVDVQVDENSTYEVLTFLILKSLNFNLYFFLIFGRRKMTRKFVMRKDVLDLKWKKKFAKGKRKNWKKRKGGGLKDR